MLEISKVSKNLNRGTQPPHFFWGRMKSYFPVIVKPFIAVKGEQPLKAERSRVMSAMIWEFTRHYKTKYILSEIRLDSW